MKFEMQVDRFTKGLRFNPKIVLCFPSSMPYSKINGAPV